MNFREITPDDLAYMETHTRYPEIYKGGVGQVDYIYALEDDGRTLAIGGFRMITKETAWCWVDMSDAGVKNRFTLYRTICEWIEKFCDTMNIWRLEACVKQNYPEGMILVEHLGFEATGTKRNFFGKQNAVLYVKLFERT